MSAHVGLRDGRRLGFTATGPEDGFPVVYLHGAIGTPLRRSEALDAVIAAYRLRYVMVDRPGFGRSDPLPGRTVLDFAHDVDELADALGFERFGVVGVSAGGPYALACAHVLADRLTAAAAVSSLGPLIAPHGTRGMALRYRLPLGALRRAPGASARASNGTLRLVRRHPGIVARAMTAGAPEADRDVLADAEARDTAVRSFLQATEAGTQGMVDDYVTCCGRWGFEPADVRGRVHLWHGMLDRLVPVEHALALGAQLRRCRVALDPDEGHFFFRRRLPEIIGSLMAGEAASVTFPEWPPAPISIRSGSSLRSPSPAARTA